MAHPAPTTRRRDAASATATPAPIVLLVVDDDLLHARVLKANIDRPGRIHVEAVESGQLALDRLSRGGVDAVLTDITMPGMDGIELVRHIRALDASLPVILMTADVTIRRAVDGIRAGATEFLPKPIDVDAVVTLVERAVAERPLRDELAERRQRRATAAPDSYVAGDHPRLDEVRNLAAQIAASPAARVLITGESGTGKSLVARAIHELSGTTGRFVEVNCAALPPQLLESELFGHEKGAFTDAREQKKGLFEIADRGTLFLDEIGTMPLELQAKLLLVLERREIRRVGGVHPIPVSARVVAATNEDLRKQVRERQFRQDLLYRLDVATIEMPPLREMPEVIPQLAERFARELCDESRRACPPLAVETAGLLAGYSWPGNARELRNAVERALIFHDGRTALVVRPPAIPSDMITLPGGIQIEAGLSLDEVERRYLAATLEKPPGDLATTAALLGISRKTLWEKRRRYNL